MGNGLGIQISADDMFKIKAQPANNKPQWLSLIDSGATKLQDLGIQIGANGDEYSQSVRAKINTDSGLNFKMNTGFNKKQGHNKYFGVGAGYNKTFSNGGNLNLSAGTGFYDGKNTKSLKEEELRRAKFYKQ